MKSSLDLTKVETSLRKATESEKFQCGNPIGTDNQYVVQSPQAIHSILKSQRHNAMVGCV